MEAIWEEMKRENSVKSMGKRRNKTKPCAPIKGNNDIKQLEEIRPECHALSVLSPDELIAKCQRDLNSLSDEQQGIRKRAIEALHTILLTVDVPTLHAVFPTFSKPLFKRFNDPVEKVRDLSIRLCIRFLNGYKDLLPLLPYITPAICNRIGSTWDYDEKLNLFIKDQTLLAAHNRGRIFLDEKEIARNKPREPSEEIRLLFIELIHTLFQTTFDQQAASLLNAYVYDLIRVLVYGLNDTYPAAVIKTCETTILLSLNLVSVMKHFAVAFVRSTKHLLEHRLSKVRVAAMLCIRTMVMVPNVDKCKGAGTEAILDLVAHQEESVIPVSAFYCPEIKVNLFAKLDQDGNVLVRQTFFDTLMIWLLELPDRYDYESRLMPYLLSAVADECPDISTKAISTITLLGKRHADEHPDDIIERTQYAVDGSLFCNFNRPYPEPFNARPNLGTRLYIRGRCRRFINTLLRELSHWQGPTRVHASRLLVCLMVYCEDTVTVDLHLIVPHLIQCWEDQLILTSTRLIADFCGRFTQPGSYISLLLPYIRGETTALKVIPALQILYQFLQGMSDGNRKNLLAQLPQLTEALGSRFVLNCKSIQPALANVISCIMIHIAGLPSLSSDPSFESQGRLVSKEFLIERLLRLLLTLPLTDPLVSSSMQRLQSISGVSNICEAYFTPTLEYLKGEYPLATWVDWSIDCVEQRLLESLIKGCSMECLASHEEELGLFLLAIYLEPCECNGKGPQRKDSISKLVVSLNIPFSSESMLALHRKIQEAQGFT